MRRAFLVGVAVDINSDPFAEVEPLFQMHPHVEQRAGQAVVGAGGYQILRVQAKPILLEHSANSGPNRVIVILGCEQLAEMHPASKAPVRRRTKQHDSMSTNGDAICETGGVRGIGAGFGLIEYGTEASPIDANVAIIVWRLKAQAIDAYSATCVRRHLGASESTQEEKGRKKLWKGSHLLVRTVLNAPGLDAPMAFAMPPPWS